MDVMSDERRGQVFLELARQLEKEGYAVKEQTTEGYLPVLWKEHPLCEVSETGGLRYMPSDVASADAAAACDRAQQIALATAEYMKLLSESPPLNVKGVGSEYRLLSEFNSAVLAGRETRYGAEFVTWERTYDRTGVTMGHYYDFGNYGGAKEDFAARAGLVSREKLLTPEQCDDIHRAVSFYMDMCVELSYEDNARLESILHNLEALHPKLAEQPDLQAGMGGMA